MFVGIKFCSVLELISYGSLSLGTKPLEDSNLKGDIIRGQD
jgi:hypothetical protein